MGKDSLQQMVLGKLDIHMQKNEVEPLPNNSVQKLIQMDQRPKHKS